MIPRKSCSITIISSDKRKIDIIVPLYLIFTFIFIHINIINCEKSAMKNLNLTQQQHSDSTSFSSNRSSQSHPIKIDDHPPTSVSSTSPSKIITTIPPMTTVTPLISSPVFLPKSSSSRSKVIRETCPLLAHSESGIGCSCYQFPDGLYIECPSTDHSHIRSSLQLLQSPIKSLTIYNLDSNLTTLSSRFFSSTSGQSTTIPSTTSATFPIESVHISFTSLTNVSPDAFNGIECCLKSLSIVSSRLKKVPHIAISKLKSLESVDFESNEIDEIESYTFYGLPLNTLNLLGNRISSLMEYSFGGLENTLDRLVIANNRLEDFPLIALRRLRKLRELKISGNMINDIPDDGFTRLIALQIIDLSSNRLSTLTDKSFVTMPKLVTLSLFNNRLNIIEDKVFTHLTELETLDLSHNSLRILSSDIFISLDKLRSLDLSHNHLHHIEFSTFHNLPTLRELFLNRNNLLSLSNDTFTNSTSITVLFLSHNAISDIESGIFHSLHHLQQLHLSYNQIKSLHSNLFKYSHELRSLSLDNNLIDTINPGTFQDLVELRDLRLQNNLLRKVRKGVFYSFPNLQELHLQYNRIEVIENEALQSCVNLQHLDMQGNKLIETGDALSRYPSNLKYLQLSNNQIFTIHNDSFSGQDKMEILWLNHNQLQKITKTMFIALASIQKIHLDHNEISIIESNSFESLVNLAYLDLSYNNLNHLSVEIFHGATRLAELRLTNNRITTISPHTFQTLPNLRILSLDHNQLITIRNSMFQSITSLGELYLCDVHLESVDYDSFASLTSLEVLDLSNNNLNLNKVSNLVIPTNLLNLNLSHNPLDNDRSVSTNRSKFFEQLQSLRKLDVSNSKLNFTSHGPFVMKNLLNINTLILSGNSIKKLDENLFSIQLSTLDTFVLDNNQLTSIPDIEILRKLPSLETFTLSSNTIRHVAASSFAQNPRLKVLNIRNNTLSILDPGSFSNTSLLKIIDVSDNVMRYISTGVFDDLAHLEELHLDGNWFQYIPNNLFRSGLTKLKHLSFNRNPMLRIREDLSVSGSLDSLESLSICDGNISILSSHDFFGFPHIKRLSLRQNNIAKLSTGCFRSISGSLIFMDLGENELENLPEERLSGMIRLETLNLTRNHLLEIPIFSIDIVSLKQLDMSYNRLSRVDSLANLGSSLEILILQNNIISFIANNAFQNLSSLQMLDLRHNFLNHLFVTPLEPVEVTIDQLYLSGNPMHCDCRLVGLWEWLHEHSRLMAINEREKDFSCSGPDTFAGQSILNLSPGDFCPLPTLSSFEVIKIRSNGVSLRWSIQNDSLVGSITLDYHLASDRSPVPISKQISPLERSIDMSDMKSESWYSVCIQANAKNMKNLNGKSRQNGLSIPGRVYGDYASSNRRCLQIRTLSFTEARISLSMVSIIIGGCVCTVFFIILFIIVGTIKYRQRRRRRRPAKDDVPEEYITYRHFSLPTSENVYS